MYSTLLSSFLLIGGPCDTVPPPLNRSIVTFVEEHLDQKVGSGECWDLVAEALDKAGAKWDGEFDFGKPVDPLRECVYPGDIIHFKNVTLRTMSNGRTSTTRMDDHTAVITFVKDRGVFQLGHQNTSTSGRKVGHSDIDLRHLVGGEYTVFRPEP
jgi:hypothetical protein